MRLMIVDDDYQIREGMRLSVEWEKLGINEVLTCANGIEAMEVFAKKRPDIILVDVQMPGMTGLEMVTEIRKITAETRVIFISAYSEFEYCRQALLFGADDYILKPIQFQKLEDTISKNVDVICKRRTQVNQYTTAILEKEVRTVYEGGKKSGKGICELLQTEYAFLKEGYFFTMVAEPDNKEKLSEPEQKEMQESLENLFLDRKNGVCLPKINDKLIFLIQGNSSALLAVYQQSELRNKILYWNQIHEVRYGSISAGISGNHDSNDFQKGYREACAACEYHFYKGDGSVAVYFTDMKAECTKKEELWSNRLLKALNDNRFEKVEEVLAQWELELQKEPVYPQNLKKTCWNVYRTLCKKENILDFPLEIETEVEKTKTLAGLFVAFRNHIYEYVWKSKHLTEQTKKYSNSVRMALQYVNEHYREPLTVSQMSEVVGKSANYFSATFKKEVGMSFTEYLTARRMEQAKKLLLTTNKKIKEVCEEVGYTDYIYFSQIFKQIHGCSASQIRQSE